jgi:multiple sugar transport system permease protein
VRKNKPTTLPHYQRRLVALLLPYLLGAMVLIVAPALLTFALAFFEYDALSMPLWRGWWNFQEVFHEKLFPIAVFNSLYFVALAVPLRLLAALGLALLLHRRGRLVGLYRAAVYLPTIIPDVAYALIWLWIFNPLYGPLNKVLALFGIARVDWLLYPDTARFAIVLMVLFQIGEGFVVLLAALQSVPHDYYDAAAVDGAGALQSFRLITLPLIAPWLLLLAVRDIILSTQSTFTPAYVMTGGDPYYATLFLPLMIYEEAFDRFRFGDGSAMLLLMFLGLGVLLVLTYVVMGGWGYGDDH